MILMKTAGQFTEKMQTTHTTNYSLVTTIRRTNYYKCLLLLFLF